MDQLPPELMDPIMGLLDTAALVSLSTCNQALKAYVEPLLYTPPSRRDETMRWACAHGHQYAIRRAVVEHGASATYVESSSGAWVLTLYLAAKYKQPGAFLQLLRLGARATLPTADDSDNDLRGPRAARDQMRKMMQWVGTRPALLAAYLAHDCDAEVRRLHCGQVAWPLVPAIQAGASWDLVRQLLDRGANPNQILICKPTPQECQDSVSWRARHPHLYQYESPLSAAITASVSCPRDDGDDDGDDDDDDDGHVPKEKELVEALLARGASIFGRVILPPLSLVPTAVPVFAAAALLARAPREGQAMLELCLRQGADLNQRACASDFRYPGCFKIRHYFWTTPLLTYLAAVPLQPTGQRYQDILSGLKFLFAHGMSAKVPYSAWNKKPRGLYHHHCAADAPYPVEVLLEKWGLEALVDDGCFAIVELLLRQKVVSDWRSFWRQMVCRAADNFSRNYQFVPKAKDVVAGWRRFLDILLSCHQQEVDVNLLLWSTVGDTVVRRRALGDMFLVSVEALLAHGANSNMRLGLDSQTALYKLCEGYWFACGDPHFNVYHRALFNLLVDNGADPSLATKEGTIIDTLRRRQHNQRCYKADEGRAEINNLVTILKRALPERSPDVPASCDAVPSTSAPIYTYCR